MKNITTFSAVGDICLGGFSSKNFVNTPAEIIPSNLKNKIISSDIVFGNLESPFSKRKGKDLSPYGFLYANPQSVNVLKYLNFNVLSLANNHICDCGYEGLFYTMELLKNKGISYVGAGENLVSARKPCVIRTKNNILVAIHAYIEQNFGNKESQKFFTATKTTPGAAPLLESIVKEDIVEAKKRYDFVVVSIHWSDIQGNQYISPKRIQICNKIRKWGASLILGHHPHVLQGFDYHSHDFIAYSLGNFYFPAFFEPGKKNVVHYWSEKERTSAILNVEFNKNKSLINYKFIPVIQIQEPPILKIPSSLQSKEILRRIDYLSRVKKKRTYLIYFLYSVFCDIWRNFLAVPNKYKIIKILELAKRLLNKVVNALFGKRKFVWNE